MAPKTSFPKNKIKVLLLENIHPTAQSLFKAEGFQLETVSSALTDGELSAKLKDGVHVLGIRSKTLLKSPVLKDAKNLLSVGCFCIGTNQVDLNAANAMGIPVFNAPFSNTRSVAEMILAEIIMLSRQLGDRSREVHGGEWKKIANGCFEVRGKTLGIVGYGHIGSQVGVLAESLGMKVIFYDVVPKLPMGNVQPRPSLSAVLAESDFLTLHVPETPQTRGMIGPQELKFLKKGSYLLNASRGSVVDLQALAALLREGHLGGAAVDVYPEEPEGKTTSFQSPLQGLPNVILTPHIGGSTEEAQANIGREVADHLIRFINAGCTGSAVNFPRVDAAPVAGTHRILNVHRNVPGVLKNINQVVSDLHANIHAQHLSTDKNIGYLVMDLDHDVSDDVKAAIEKLDTSIRTRILY
jgi:D-3-phosphoglycerate dehydrogenase